LRIVLPHKSKAMQNNIKRPTGHRRGAEANTTESPKCLTTEWSRRLSPRCFRGSYLPCLHSPKPVITTCTKRTRKFAFLDHLWSRHNCVGSVSAFGTGTVGKTGWKQCSGAGLRCCVLHCPCLVARGEFAVPIQR
jgi:hypothetical protein